MDEREYYNQVYLDSIEYKKHPSESKYLKIWNRIIEITDNEEWLFEIGCGPGQLAKLLIDNGRNYFYGWDYSEVAIDMAKKNNLNNEDKFIVKDVYTLPKFDSDDTVICTEVLEHLDNDLFVLDLLSKGTRFLFSVPNFICTSHRRCFKSAEQVRKRYQGLEYKSITPYKMGRKGIIFLADTVKL
jgi:SAM-dependent methyltransferase